MTIWMIIGIGAYIGLMYLLGHVLGFSGD